MKYPIGIQSFEYLRQEGFVYVDKTALLYRLATEGKYYFLSRPRRFGKSLLVSTLEAYFMGKKELFSGLAIEQVEKEWKTYPVFRLDLNARNYEGTNALVAELNKHLKIWEEAYGIDTDTGLAPEERFYNLVWRAYVQTGQRVVVLIDEYDKPLLSTMANRELHDAYLNTLKGLYGVLKTLDECIRFGLITGVSRFSHVSIFSDLNNLVDISMDPEYVDLCGISEQDLHAYFDESIHKLAAANGMTFEEACDELGKRYDGYHFYPNTTGIYNPYSLLNTLKRQIFDDYWFETGTPTFLARLLRDNDYALEGLKGIYVDKEALKSADESLSDPIPVLYQTGYLTIADYDSELGYRLDFPNQEVERGFYRFLIPYYTSLQASSVRGYLNTMALALKQGHPDKLLLSLQTMLAGKNYMLAGGDKEVHFQNSLYLIFTMLGYNVQVEQATSTGRMDITIQTKDYIYIIELKLDKSAEEALQQIKANHYARPFQTDKRKLFLIGVNFSSATRTVENWLIAD